ncbi:type I-E CRISPR-associated protein Cas5/CasD [Pararhodospirillum photometricum]|uniref:CRISPR-associated protein, Cas5e family n=1 Tax=Pararhodospirillum photometricum DSM 122 TaxID=1150469 RepID=H6SKX3_PARPM|nr:type I-E CRISPR-associated protein Cas5/CasD [Pararhodospirillum photometricum]CCG08638.1 CRISPR-associated protein, Cas5e family [Pararhodospirillum photometricum DSM 122]
MTLFLTLTLYAPLAAFGAIAVGETRPSWPRPGRSAVLGVVAAALGLARDEEEALASLGRDLGLAVRDDAPGQPLSDYHTTQVPAQKRGRVHRTRQEELAAPDLNTILSQREYRTDALHSVALWRRPTADPAGPSLEAVAQALRRPGFAPYLGRRSCPFGLPLDPQLIEAATAAEALAARVVKAPEQALRTRLKATGQRLAVDLDAPDRALRHQPSERIETRRDEPLCWGRRQFRERAVAVFTPKTTEEARS